ncbi:hypothetical protein RQP46_000382 [Phenoliferia psychrophenolica]
MPPTRTRRPKASEAPAGPAPLSPTFNADVYAMVASYGDIAKLLGRPQNSRLVGAALKVLPPHLSSPDLPAPAPTSPSSSSSSQGDDVLPAPQPNPDFVPWHRILSSSGIISPRAGGIRPLIRQADFLRAEGVEVNDGPRAGGANAGPVGGLDAFGLGGLHGGRVSMAQYRWNGA